MKMLSKRIYPPMFDQWSHQYQGVRQHQDRVRQLRGAMS